MKVKWTEHKTNDEVLDMVKEKRMLLQIIRERQKNCVGHILRSDSLLRTVWERSREGWKERKQQEDQERNYLTG